MVIDHFVYRVDADTTVRFIRHIASPGNVQNVCVWVDRVQRLDVKRFFTKPNARRTRIARRNDVHTGGQPLPEIRRCQQRQSMPGRIRIHVRYDRGRCVQISDRDTYTPAGLTYTVDAISLPNLVRRETALAPG